MSDKWNKILERAKENYVKLLKLSPELANFNQIVEKKENEILNKKTRALIALGVAVATGCKECIAAHTRKAVHAGVTREELGEAMKTAVAVWAGAAISRAARVADAYCEKIKENESA